MYAPSNLAAACLSAFQSRRLSPYKKKLNLLPHPISQPSQIAKKSRLESNEPSKLRKGWKKPQKLEKPEKPEKPEKDGSIAIALFPAPHAFDKRPPRRLY